MILRSGVWEQDTVLPLKLSVSRQNRPLPCCHSKRNKRANTCELRAHPSTVCRHGNKYLIACQTK
jgi:hypothetical protein